jgi:hypothetical protein
VLGERRVLDRRGVTLAEDETISLRPIGVPRVVTKNAVIERRDDVGRRERGVEVARLRDRDHPQTVDSEHGCAALQFGDRKGL